MTEMVFCGEVLPDTPETLDWRSLRRCYKENAHVQVCTISLLPILRMFDNLLDKDYPDDPLPNRSRRRHTRV